MTCLTFSLAVCLATHTHTHTYIYICDEAWEKGPIAQKSKFKIF